MSYYLEVFCNTETRTVGVCTEEVRAVESIPWLPSFQQPTVWNHKEHVLGPSCVVKVKTSGDFHPHAHCDRPFVSVQTGSSRQPQKGVFTTNANLREAHPSDAACQLPSQISKSKRDICNTFDDKKQ